jgi:hypothetical protein
MIKGASLWWVLPLSYLSNNIDLSGQDAGQNVPRSGRQVTDMKLKQPRSLSSISSAVRVGHSIDMASAKVVSREHGKPF